VREGALARLPERHLGLVPPRAEAAMVLEQLADAVAEGIDLDAVVSLAGPLSLPAPEASGSGLGAGLRLGLAWDEAFRFAYGPVVAALESHGVEVVRFSPLHDRALPGDLDGLWICGGYPEVSARELSRNAAMREAVRGFCATGRPVLAECGGLLYLARELVDVEGTVHRMCGAVPAVGRMRTSLQALGYRTATAREDLFLAAQGACLRGHEFHYGSLEGEPEGRWRRAWELEGSRGRIGAEGWWDGAVLATWFHGWLCAGDALERWIGAMRRARAAG